MKIICFDLDGTLLNENELIHPSDINILLSNRRAIFVIATGRALPSIKGVLNLNGLFLEEKIPFPILSQNGAVLYKPEEKLLEMHSFDFTTQNHLISYIDRFPKIPFFFFGENDVYLINPNKEAHEYASKWYYPLEYSKDGFYPPASKVMGLCMDLEMLHEFSDSIQHMKIETSFSLILGCSKWEDFAHQSYH